MKEKHSAYFNFIDACREKECPVCFLTKNKIEKYFDSLLYEYINDPGFREEFAANNGFCNYHSYKFLGYHDELAISITHLEILKNKIKELKAAKVHPKKSGYCIICNLIKEIESRYITVIVENIDNPEFKNEFLSSAGLCIPHYERLLMEIRRPIPAKWLVDFQIKKYDELYEQLSKLNDSLNESPNKSKIKLSNDEMNSCKKAVKELFGFEGKTQNK
jgi:hypothetical protein